ncbi:primosomal protein N' [Nitrosovibrio sp. Nv17]|uniref:primosomal protein N' n=1 Tax=Nitrosovibrio sp. Nv17 TaxID=1855339 RepID=UPI0009088F93|nr:primosomal protein N' [Nitrosovibrio sp. Nv17]SFW27322.1 replication restart DNA helicase PriA [Nitrosovibrio sp. Nv17]
MPVIRVALDVPVHTLFDYVAPDATERDVGARVCVPLGNRRMVGVIVEMAADAATASRRLKNIFCIFRDAPPLPADLLDVLRFCSAYYHHPLGAVVMHALPARLRSPEPMAGDPGAARYRLTAAGRAIDPSVIPARRKIRRQLLAQFQESGVLRRDEARRRSRSAPAALEEFVQLGWIEEFEDGPRNASGEPAESPAGTGSMVAEALPPGLTLTEDQAHAVRSITSAMHDYHPWLLQGVTGSGKTEVYLRLIAHVLHQGRQALVLVPEISLTPQLEAVFRARFPATPLIRLHSGLASGERVRAWLQARQGAARIILGTRLAVFTPMSKLGLIIVDEEHDASFKQQEGLRYSARDTAIFRARHARVPVVLGSATPSLESYRNAADHRYHGLFLRTRANRGASLPAIRCVDLRTVETRDGLSAPLIAALAERLALRQQSLVFINRRGYAPVLRCKSCAWVATCHRCASRLVAHLREKCLRCHHCGHQERFPQACAACGNQDVTLLGHGTQRIEAALAERFPEARILRIDRDSTRRRNAWPSILEDIQAQRVDILVGTQILAKGHDFPHLSLVGILNPDASLFSTDFRASERLFAQLMQVAGRAGRADIPGEVLVQTEFPGHPLYQALRRHDYDALAQELLAERRAAGFPPYVHQALLRAEAPQIATALAFLDRAAAAANPTSRVQVFDPVPAHMARLKGVERAYLLVQAGSRSQLQAFLSAWRERLDALPGRKVRWTLDVDPLEF